VLLKQKGKMMSEALEQMAENAQVRFDFGGALHSLREGKRVTRDGWNGEGMYIQLQTPDEHSKMRRPYVYMSPVDGNFVPWVASHSDLLALDWRFVD
jgi:uncharacterized protein DUF2829